MAAQEHLPNIIEWSQDSITEDLLFEEIDHEGTTIFDHFNNREWPKFHLRANKYKTRDLDSGKTFSFPSPVIRMFITNQRILLINPSKASNPVTHLATSNEVAKKKSIDFADIDSVEKSGALLHSKWILWGLDKKHYIRVTKKHNHGTSFNEVISFIQSQLGASDVAKRAKKLAENAASAKLTGDVLSDNVNNTGNRPLFEYLDEGEQPHYFFEGASLDVESGGSSMSIFGGNRSRKFGTHKPIKTLVTEKRIMSIVPQKMGTDERHIPYDAITGVDLDKSFYNRISIQTHGRTYHIGIMSGSDFDAAIQYIRKRRNKANQSPLSNATDNPSNAETEDHVQMLRQLAELRDDGVISSEEFQVKKENVLERI